MSIKYDPNIEERAIIMALSIGTKCWNSVAFKDLLMNTAVKTCDNTAKTILSYSADTADQYADSKPTQTWNAKTVQTELLQPLQSLPIMIYGNFLHRQVLWARLAYQDTG